MRIYTLYFLMFLSSGSLFASCDPFGFSPVAVSELQIVSRPPVEAFNRLKQGNLRYAADRLEGPDRSSLRRMEIHQKQKPFATIVGCSDSRVPPEIIFDQGLGDLFVVRVAGQVVGPIELDSIEYAAKYLGTSLVFVLGHQFCAAVDAVLKGETADIEDVADLIRPALKSVKKKTLENAIKANVRWVVEHLKKTPVIQQLIQDQKIDVVGGYYTLPDGKIEILQ